MSHPVVDGRSEPTQSQYNFERLPLYFSPLEAAWQLSLSRYTVYQEVKAGRLRALRYGSRILIPREELERFADTLEQK